MSNERKYQNVNGLTIAGFLILVVLVGGFGAWSVLSSLSGAVIANAQIEVEQNRQIVQHPDGGVVSAVHVREGQFVTEGQRLIMLETEKLSSQLMVTENALYELLARRGRLISERDRRDSIRFAKELRDVAQEVPRAGQMMVGQETLFIARAHSLNQQFDQLSQRSEQLRDQIDGYEAQKAGVLMQLDLIEKELDRQKILEDKGLSNANQKLTMERELASLHGQIGQLSANIAQTKGRITEIAIEARKLEAGKRETVVAELREIRLEEIELRTKIEELSEQIARSEIKAPVSGIVYGLQVFTPKSVLRAADPVLYLIPQDRPLVIAAQVEPIHIDQISLDQEATLRFSSFSQQTTPEFVGRVRQISADVFQSPDNSYQYYRVLVELSEEDRSQFGGAINLLPGMPVEAFFRTSDHTPMHYFVKPLADYFNKAFRET
ncbi:HlyD family type I secretion periplasmic adaptor subunit [uncultured Ruegeria sp.]|uniref:HlyD family type I secretion periplasmic adaptor subunit n=1 Tax=uncultured Ruegeria sp. TaxID=259304 RepID=UPI0026377697|nr:HlyD family type I secretion periplasmic adaptor subunit [uncultured Ruegeria sp.]